MCPRQHRKHPNGDWPQLFQVHTIWFTQTKYDSMVEWADGHAFRRPQQGTRDRPIYLGEPIPPCCRKLLMPTTTTTTTTQCTWNSWGRKYHLSDPSSYSDGRWACLTRQMGNSVLGRIIQGMMNISGAGSGLCSLQYHQLVASCGNTIEAFNGITLTSNVTFSVVITL